MAFRVTIKARRDANFSRNVATTIERLSDRQINAMAVLTTETMKQKVKEAVKRADSSGNLENSITFQQTTRGYGVGNISFMYQVAPYWRHVNFGSTGIGAAHSHRVPVGGFMPGFEPPISGRSTQRWFLAQGGFSFIPTQPIAPLHYIENTLFEVPNIILNVLRTIR